MSKTLFDSARLGDITLANRIVMAPMTRGRADDNRIPTQMMATYYGQRASAGLIITEATAISAQGYGWDHAPALYTDAMEEGWKAVTDSVHKEGGKIMLQLWHMGRVSHPDFLNGALPVGPSPIAAKGEAHTPSGKKPYVTPRALEESELAGIVQDYAAATKRALNAGFDGVEIHAANGYLLDQFIRDGSNQRADGYGGSIENRLRLVMEVVEAVVGVAGAGRTGIRFSPTNHYNDMHDSAPVKTFTCAAEMLTPFNLAYLHIMEPFSKTHMLADADGPYVTPSIAKVYHRPMIINGGYDLASGNDALDHHLAEAVAFGIPFIANPDFVHRLRTGSPMNEANSEFFYGGGDKGYTDYPFLSKAA
jgi:N-ethylmaleimide reductase